MSAKRSAVCGILALAMLFAACHESTPPNNHPQTTDECGDIKAAVFPVINGVLEPDPDVANLNESQQLAVGALLINYGMAMCTGTLVAPNVVLTAAHCIDFPVSSISFIGGRDLRSPDFSFAATAWHEHPDYSGNYPEFDIAVVLIGGDTAARGITPIPVNLETTRIVGETVQTVGYGETRGGGPYNSLRWWTTLYINMESTFYRSTYGDALTGMCQGDSGGPMLYTMPDGIVYVMGPLSSGDDDSCLGHDFYPRTDFYADFIESYLPQDPCAGETLQGRCDGQTAVWCEAGAVVRDDCASRGYLCGDDGTGSFRCAAPPDPCAGETWEGRCDGQTAVWCEDETVMRDDCAPRGYLCGALEDGLSRCIDECALIGREGRCDESGRARWCEDGVLRVRDCAFCGFACGWVDDSLGYYCL